MCPLLCACEGMCSAACEGMCSAACEGTCSAACEGMCSAACEGMCCVHVKGCVPLHVKGCVPLHVKGCVPLHCAFAYFLQAWPANVRLPSQASQHPHQPQLPRPHTWGTTGVISTTPGSASLRPAQHDAGLQGAGSNGQFLGPEGPTW